MFSLHGRTGLVTGASRGIGRAIATDLAASGAALALHARTTRAEFREFGDSISAARRSARVFGGDLRNPTDVKRLLSGVRRWSSRLDFVVANAGVYEGSATPDVTEFEWDRVLSTNLRGAFRTVRGALPLLAQSSHASVVLVSSILATRASRGGVPYQSSKAGVEQMGRALAVELAPHVRVNTVAPGFIRTDMNREGHEDPVFRHRVEGATPMGRWGDPDDIAPVVRFLVSDAASWITGATLLVDGGLGLQ